ncbi:MAG: Sulfotransferase family [Actinomycetia bacterium]|nr:Sulfotransferase family [Actinomycetes bacterium]
MGVYVLGMHRSGTSAVTRVVNLCGVPIGREERLMPVQVDNPAGFWEHLGLMDVDDAVLERLGGTWDAPPEPAPDFADRAELADLRDRARAEFDATYEGDRWVFKDPRAGVVLPFWRRVLDGTNDVAVIVLRNPLDIAASLAQRNQFAVRYTLALWERYTRLIHRDATGMPALVIDYDTLVDDPAVTGRLQEFLIAHDQIAGTPDRDAIRLFLATSLRHSRQERGAFEHDARVTGEQRALFAATGQLLGAHDRFAPGPVPAESPTTEPLIASRREPSTPERAALDTVTRALGETECRLDACEASTATTRTTHDAVDDALGYTDIGRLERVALGAARRVRRIQQRLTRR